MAQTLATISTSNCVDLSFAGSYISDNVIQANFRQDNRGFDEDAEFFEIMQSVANQFDEAFRKLAD